MTHTVSSRLLWPKTYPICFHWFKDELKDTLCSFSMTVQTVLTKWFLPKGLCSITVILIIVTHCLTENVFIVSGDWLPHTSVPANFFPHKQLYFWCNSIDFTEKCGYSVLLIMKATCFRQLSLKTVFPVLPCVKWD